MSDNVEHADNVENAELVISADVVNTTNHHEVVTPEVQPRTKRLKSLILLVALVFFAGQLVSGLLSVRAFQDKATDKHRSEQQIADLKQQLEAQIAKTQQALDIKQAKDACFNIYTGRITVANAEVLANQSELFVQAFHATSPDPEVRRVALDPYVAVLDMSKETLRAAAKARDRYVASGSPLPCPVEVP